MEHVRSSGEPYESRPQLRDLKRVVPIARTHTVRGMAITLFSLDVYAQGFQIHGRLLLPQEHPVVTEAVRRSAVIRATAERGPENVLRQQEGGAAFLASPRPTVMMTAMDNRGREYTNFGGESRFRGDEFTWHPVFGPALDASADIIRFEIAEVRWDAPDSRGSQSPLAERNLGPWTFTATLSRGLDVIEVAHGE